MKSCLRTYCAVDLKALRSNVVNIKRLLPRNTKLMCVVKANAYSHGAVQVARACEDLADYFGVATVEEGEELRNGGLSMPILILGAVLPSSFETLIKYDLQASIYSLKSARLLSEFCVKNGVVAKAHLAVDTGMGRIGFLPNEKHLALNAARLKGLQVNGIFTHFACADSKDKTYTRLQAARFDEFVAYLKDCAIDIPIVHAANSGGILDGSYAYDMARCGIITYGLYPSGEVEKRAELTPALSWHTAITHIKTLEKGASVSYGAAYTADRQVKVATLAVGYADGYPRALSGRADVLIKGKRAKIIGRICMDQMMVDVTHINDVKVYDEATLIGRQGDEQITAEELAAACNTINYEILCSITNRVDRIYSY